MVGHVHVIGIGSGNLDHLTLEAINALNQVDVFLVADKGPAKHDLVGLREEICARFITDHDYRVIEVADPVRGPDAQRDTAGYRGGVMDWHTARAERYESIMINDIEADQQVGFLVWGDPALYDSTIRIVDTILARGRLSFDYSVVPGISSVSVLAARHRIVLNRIGTSIHITTGRRLVEEYDPSLGDVVVMLDGDLACEGLLDTHPDLIIFWGAYLGETGEVLIAGPLADVIGTIRETRTHLRQQRGWLMDTYLLRPPD